MAKIRHNQGRLLRRGNERYVILDKPLENIKVLDLTRFIAGPFCSMLLGDMGADVIKIEPPTGDDARNVGRDLIGGESSIFLQLNRNKRSLCLDISRDKGLRVFFELVKDADVIIENYRPGTTQNLGIDYNRVKAVNPGIVYCSLSAFGHTGPYSKRPGLDMVVQAMSGIMAISGEPDGKPMRPGFPAVDSSSGIMAAYGVVLGLFSRQRTGKGMQVNLSLLDHAIAIQCTIVSLFFARNCNPPRLGNASPFTLAQDFETKDGRYITLSIGNERFWQRFREALQSRELFDDPRFETMEHLLDHMDDLVKICRKRFLEKDGKDWEKRLIRGGIPCSLVNTYEEVFANEQVKHNQVVFEVAHPTAKKLKQVRSPLLLNDEIMTGRGVPPPLLGEHSREILRESGCDENEIENLEREGIILGTNNKKRR